MKVMFFLLVSPLLAESPSFAFRVSQSAVIVSSVADIVSSYHGTEANPILGRGRFGAKQIAIKSGMTAAILTFENYMVARHPAARKPFAIVNFAVAGAQTGAVIRNSRIR